MKSKSHNFTATTLFILCSLATYAQIDEVHQAASTLSVSHEILIKSSSKLLVDTRISALLETYDLETSINPTLQGFRIELFSSSGENSRNKATQLKEAFEKKYPEKSAYVVWEYPNFELHIGNYRTKLEAEYNLSKIRDEYPFAFVTKSQIELPELVLENKKAE